MSCSVAADCTRRRYQGSSPPLRHTFATWAIESGARGDSMEMLLGHSDLTMTQRYARTCTSEQAVRALVPQSRESVTGLKDRDARVG
ncbi:MAG: site-specific integrase [Dehalococcoidia bacterium]|uniref:site-specific integrase n=1 Tax=Candidatus Amarobacter glycogenicus TaxID=3140699 RepID=UPI003136B205|nr:site-specific integrase [Dehalococcoidia bacterium]